MQVEGAIGYMLMMGVAIALGTKLFSVMTNKAMEHKGLIGMLFACYAATFFLLINNRAVADFIGVSRNDVNFIAILFFVIPTVLILIVYREQTKKSAKAGISITKKVTKSAKTAKAKITGK